MPAGSLSSVFVLISVKREVKPWYRNYNLLKYVLAFTLVLKHEKETLCVILCVSIPADIEYREKVMGAVCMIEASLQAVLLLTLLSSIKLHKGFSHFQI